MRTNKPAAWQTIEIDRKVNIGTSISIDPYKMLILYVLLALLSILITSPETGWLNWYLSIAWSIHIFATMTGFIQSARTSGIELSTFPGKTERKVIFLVPSICRKNTIPALIRVVDSILLYAPRNLSDFRIDIVIEERSEGKADIKDTYKNYPLVRIVEVPEGYTTPNRTKYKARAAQYALEERKKDNENSENTYIYHLDDDTHTEEDTIASIAEFIETKHGNYYLAQGVLTFPHELSTNWFCKFADSIRPTDDLTRLRFFTETLGTPLGGLHGEHLLIRADIEEEIGWDFGNTLVEDACFALRFSEKYPRKAAFLNSRSYGASPSSIADFIKQRKRWSSGLIKLIFDNNFSLKIRLPLIYLVASWSLGIFQFVGIVLLVAHVAGVNNTSPLLIGFVFIWSFNLTYFAWLYMEGLKINMSVSRIEYSKTAFVIYPIAIIPMVYAFALIEGISSFLGLMRCIRGNFAFEVIKKEL